VTDSPIPEPADPTDRVAAARALAWSSMVIAVATAFLFLFNAASMRSWASSWPPSRASAELFGVTSAWEGETAKFGLTAPHAWMHDVWKKQQARTWSAPDPGQRPPPG
jgi:hypothetical protein